MDGNRPAAPADSEAGRARSRTPKLKEFDAKIAAVKKQITDELGPR